MSTETRRPYLGCIVLAVAGCVTHRHLRLSAPNDASAVTVLNHLALRAVEALPEDARGQVAQQVWRMER